MWNVGRIPPYLWSMLLLPSAVLAMCAAVWRKSFFRAVLSFSLATVFASMSGSFYTVFVMRKFDSKFRYAPDVAFELSVFGDAVVAVIGLLLFGATLAFHTRQAMYGTALLWLAALFGVIYATLPKAFYWSNIRVPVIVWWIWTLLIPVAAAWLISRHVGQGRRERLGVCADTGRRPSFR
jgi:hypothetical protein